MELLDQHGAPSSPQAFGHSGQGQIFGAILVDVSFVVKRILLMVEVSDDKNGPASNYYVVSSFGCQAKEGGRW
eukprot:459567-Prorocentrum_lima.AAC.1